MTLELRRTLWAWGRWLVLYAIATIFFAQVVNAPELRIAHGVLVYLLLIIGAARETRRWLSVFMVAAGYFAVDWFFVPPLHSFSEPSHFDLVILVGFILTGFIITRLVSSMHNAVKLATERAGEIEQLGLQQLERERGTVRVRESMDTANMKNALIASIAHDLRSPITTMKMLADPSYGIAPALALRRIADEADRINRYLSTMRHFSAVGSSATMMNVEAHVVDDLIGTALASYAGLLQGRIVNVAQGPADEILLVRCDVTLSLQVLGNLLQNAARYAPPPSPIDIWFRSENEQVRIVVADRGPGVTSEEAELIFRARHRGASEMPHVGEGMGLAISRTFARAQLGDIEYRDRDGGGAEFSFILPAAHTD